jgi:hypothetical protein
LILGAAALVSYQECRRRFLLQSDYLPTKYRAKSLFDNCLRGAIFALSNGSDPITLADDASSRFMQLAADPGLDLPAGNPYVLAKDYVAMLNTIVRSLAKLTLLTIKQPPPEQLSADVQWRVRSWADDSGTLHRWITIDSWSDADLIREMHSWFSAGDMAATGAGMILHVIEIGQVRRVASRVAKNGTGRYGGNGIYPEMRRASPWARGWRHPAIPQIQALRFKRPGGEGFTGWEPIYLADSRQNPDDWVEAMWKDGAAQALVHHLTVDALPEQARKDAVEHILAEASAMQSLAGTRWQSLPMSRNACDGLVPCSYCNACYPNSMVDPAASGLYKLRSGIHPMEAQWTPTLR